MPRVTLRRALVWAVGSLVAFSFALDQTRADDRKPDAAPGKRTTKPAAVDGSTNPTEKSIPSRITIEQVRLFQTGGKTLVRVEGSGDLSYVPSRLSQPDRLALDFNGAFVRLQHKLTPSHLEPVRAVRVGQFKDDVARVVIDLTGIAPYTIYAGKNVVTVRFESSALVGSSAPAAKETPIAVDASPADFTARLFEDHKDTDMDEERTPSPVAPTALEAVPNSPAIAQGKPSESTSDVQRLAGFRASPPPAPAPVLGRDPTADAAEQPGNAPGDYVSVSLADDYTIGLQDVLAISVWGEPELSKSARVRPDGKISLPLVGELKASGLTPLALQMLITKQLETYMQSPEVTVSVQEVNSQRFSIIGEVQRPGSYVLTKPMTVLDAVAIGGGFAEFAKLKKIFVLRRVPAHGSNGGSYEELRIYVNYKEVINGERPEQNVELEPGDTVVVP